MHGTECEPPTISARCKLPTQWGEFQLSALLDPRTSHENCALSMGRVNDGDPVLVRIHSECVTGDAFGSLRCDCGSQLQAAMRAIAGIGRGAIIYLRQEGRGIGLANKVRAYALQDNGADTVDANRLLGFADDLRRYDDAKTLLAALGIANIHLMTNNPRKLEALQSLGINIVDRVPLHVGRSAHNCDYLDTKAIRMGHFVETDRDGLERGIGHARVA